MGWHGVANSIPRQQDATPGSFCKFLFCFIHVAKEGSPEIFAKLNFVVTS